MADPPTVILTAHATRQLTELGRDAELAVSWLRRLTLDEIQWLAEPLPAQHGEMWLLWAEGVRVLFDVEESDLTIHGLGLGLRPRSTAPRRR